MQTSLVILKPDCVDRWLIWEVISRFESKWLKISWMKMMQLGEEVINEHYDFLKDKPFFPDIKAYMTRTPVVAMAVSWANSISIIRSIAWATNPAEALPGTIRWDLWLTIDWNIMHASDSEETAEVELKRFFGGEGIFYYKRVIDDVL